MLVLGVGGFMHDYNYCLVDVVGARIAMAEAERLSRRKHHAIRASDDLLIPVQHFCEELGVGVTDIDAVVLGHTDPFPCKEHLRRDLPACRPAEIDHHLCHADAIF